MARIGKFSRDRGSDSRSPDENVWDAPYESTSYTPGRVQSGCCATARVKGKSGNIGSFEDVDGDGDLDLVVQFPTSDLQLTEADIEAALDGVITNGTPIQATDPIGVVP